MMVEVEGESVRVRTAGPPLGEIVSTRRGGSGRVVVARELPRGAWRSKTVRPASSVPMGRGGGGRRRRRGAARASASAHAHARQSAHARARARLDGAPYEWTPAAAGNRALASRCLRYLVDQTDAGARAHALALLLRFFVEYSILYNLDSKLGEYVCDAFADELASEKKYMEMDKPSIVTNQVHMRIHTYTYI